MKEKAPYHRHYPKDHLAETFGMSWAAIGMYDTLRDICWMEGSIPREPAAIARLLKVPPGTFAKVWTEIQRQFDPEDDRLIHPGVEGERMRIVEGRPVLAGTQGSLKKWQKEKIDKRTRYERLTEARKKGIHSREEWLDLVTAIDYKCLRCGEEKPLVKDHVKLISNGGSDHISNIQPLCRNCNSAKGPDETDLVPEEIRLQLGHILPSIVGKIADELSPSVLPASPSIAVCSLQLPVTSVSSTEETQTPRARDPAPKKSTEEIWGAPEQAAFLHEIDWPAGGVRKARPDQIEAIMKLPEKKLAEDLDLRSLYMIRARLLWFEEFWPEYWRRVDKHAARIAYFEHVTSLEIHDKVITSVAAQSAEMLRRPADKQPHAATWINHGRWEDETAEPENGRLPLEL